MSLFIERSLSKTFSLKQSSFLFGPRGSGKSTFLRQFLQNKIPLEKIFMVNLLDEDVYERYLKNPRSLEYEIEILKAKPKIIYIDEIQRLPKLLNIVHKLIEEKKYCFILTGSSARKIKKEASNLLAGRAFVYNLFPFTSIELIDIFKLDEVLRFGSLPSIFHYKTNTQKIKYLKSYALTYLKEEIVAEQITRKLEPFRNFLEVSAQLNGKIINFSKISKSVGVDLKTIQAYFQILEDTLVGFTLPSYHNSLIKSLRTHPKFYWFDIGVKKVLEKTLDIPMKPQTSFYGETFEHFVILEFYKRNINLEKDYQLSFYHAQNDFEVDLVLSRPRRPPIFIEIKSTNIADESEIKKLNDQLKIFKNSKIYYLSRDPIKKKIGSVFCYPWNEGIMTIMS
jgi:predicted AAA+ superfamily ATPase